MWWMWRPISQLRITAAAGTSPVLGSGRARDGSARIRLSWPVTKGPVMPRNGGLLVRCWGVQMRHEGALDTAALWLASCRRCSASHSPVWRCHI